MNRVVCHTTGLPPTKQRCVRACLQLVVVCPSASALCRLLFETASLDKHLVSRAHTAERTRFFVFWLQASPQTAAHTEEGIQPVTTVNPRNR